MKTNRDTFLDGDNAMFLEAMYESFLNDPDSIPAQWKALFRNLANGGEASPLPLHSEVRKKFRNHAYQNRMNGAVAQLQEAPDENGKQIKILQLINSYRFLGHRAADTNPLDAACSDYVRPEVPELTLQYHALSESDLKHEYRTGSLVAPPKLPLSAIIEILERSYCDKVGFQYMHISSIEEKRWLQERIEGRALLQQPLSREERVEILSGLTASETLERYLHTKYIGQKRFSIEGADSFIPLLRSLVHEAGIRGTQEVVIGMAHRGRLNVLINILGKSPARLFKEFAGETGLENYTGDVKYHQGYASDISTPGGPVHLALAFNPSHLEIVGPIVEGAVRARQDRRHKDAGQSVIPLVVHGDAALAGQGVNMEMLNMAETRGYRTHGTVHIVINNQIGFTTSTRIDSRSTEYCTDIAKMVNAPVFHVNGDSPEAVIKIARLALEYRQTFNKDVFIDLVCYRRHGHNEADEPSVTQPMMYKKIRALPTTRTLYAIHLAREGIIETEQATEMVHHYRKSLEQGHSLVPNLLDRSTRYLEFPVNWKRFHNSSWRTPSDTAITEARYRQLGERLSAVPDDFKVSPRVAPVLEKRAQMAQGELPADWGFAENLAYAALVQEGFPVRLSGEDSGRGTFFHRHAVLHDQETGKSHIPLQHISEDQTQFTVIDSLLSEEAVLAFEYGYATTEADILDIWEAQFGDFFNCAQVVIDQFIVSAEQKWGLLSGLVLYLPHGYEGMGPEHSSARLERFLQLCAQENMQVCVPSTPAQHFHLIRRQMIRRYRKPLVVFTPKSLLRHPEAISPMASFTDQTFQCVIDETEEILPGKRVRKVILCTGKVYYELLAKRRQHKLNDVAIIRIEQLYPFPEEELLDLLRQYSACNAVVWCQEEPANQGAWLNIRPWLQELLEKLGATPALNLASRPAMAAPAEGSHKAHVIAQERLLNAAFELQQ
jgi:2-oxoglutarate dehydrogenase E1 component